MFKLSLKDVILKTILQSKLGQFIDGIDKDNISMGLWSGNLLIENATLKAEAFEKFKLPFTIKYAKISKLKATVPWMSLSSSPVEILLDSLMITLISKPKHKWEIVDLISNNYKKEIIATFAESLLNSLRKSDVEDETEGKGFLERLSMRILDNIQLKIQNIHVRYEINLDSDIDDQSGFTLGLKLEQLNVITTNEKWDFQFLDRTVDENKDKPMLKLLSLSNLSLYSDSRRINSMNIVDTFSINEEKDKAEINYIMRPISANVRLKTSHKFDNKTPKYWIEMVVEDFSLNLKKKELINIIKIIERVTQYQKFQDTYNKTQKYKFLRPIYSILDERKFENCGLNSNPNAKMWWRYAIECVLRTIRMKNGAPCQFILSSVAKAQLEKQYKNYFNRVFNRKQELNERIEGTNGGKIQTNSENISPIVMELNTIENNILDDYEKGQYDYILGALDLHSLKDWTTIVVKKFHEKEKEIENKKYAQSNTIWNVFSWISGSKAEETKEIDQSDKEHGDENSEFHISEKEVEEINKLIQSSLEGISEAEREENNLYLQIQYRCIKGELNIEDDSTNNKSGVLFTYSNCCFSMNKKISRELEFTTSMENLALDMFCQGSSRSKVIYLPLFRTLSTLTQSKDLRYNDEYNHSIYEIKVIRNREGSLVDFEIDIVVEPMYFYYRALLQRIIKSFTSLGNSSSEELKLTAWDKFYLAKENTKEKIQSTLLKTTNVLRCVINSPKVILPFSQNNDMRTPAYVLRVGNLKLSLNKENLNEPIYKYMNLSIQGTQLQYFESMNLWQRYEKDSIRVSLKDDKLFNGLNKEVFNVIEELDIGFKVGQRIRNITETTENKEDLAEFIVEGKISDIKINMTAEKYNSIINFNKMIEISDQDFVSKIMMNEKNEILNNSSKTGFLRKRGDRLEYWNKQFVILSGSYLYFYHEDFEQVEDYESWFYLKDAYVDLYEEGEDLENIFYLSNNDNPIYLYASDEESMKSWIKEIRERIFEIKTLTEGYETQSTTNEIRITQQMRTSMLNNPEVKVFQMNLEFEKLEYNMINDDFSKFLSFAISEMNLNFETTTKADIVYQNERIRSFDRKYSYIIEADIQKIKVHDLANSIFLIESINPVNLSICILNKNSTHFKGDTFCISVFIDIVHLNFLPESVKKMIMFFRHVDFQEPKANANKQKRKSNEKLNEEVKEDINSKEFDQAIVSHLNENDIQRHTDKRLFKDNKNLFTEKSIMKLNLAFLKVNLTLINPSTKKPYIYINADKLLPVYELKQGYHLLKIKCENMPIKIETPLFGCFDVLHMNLDRVSNKDYIPFDLTCEFYKEDMLSLDSKINNKIMLNLDEIILHYQHENVMRFKDYFFDQFINAITGDTILKEPTIKWFSMKNEDIKKINYIEVDLEQSDKFNLIEINIRNPMILLRDRPHSAANFAFSIKEMKMINSIKECKGRWIHFKDKICLETDFNIWCDSVVLSYNSQKLTNIFNMSIDLQTIVNTKIVEEIQNNELEKVLHVNIKVDEHMKLALTQNIYTFLLRTMDLNLNFTDSLQHEYVFK